MALQSTLFRGDPKLEAAATSDSAHITPGSSGPHVAKIQAALNEVDEAHLDVDGKYGPATSAAVLSFKRSRNIVNRAYQTQADNIVGKMTIVALDQELASSPDPQVIIGRPSVGPRLLFAVGDPPVSPTAIRFTAIVRGNPYVRANAV